MATVPSHIAIIMDGNGRWAKRRMMPRAMGHRAGGKTAKAIVRAASYKGVRALTLFAFGVDNWKRPAEEVSLLMQLFIDSLDKNIQELHENQVRFSVIGDISVLSQPLQDLVARSTALTQHNTGMALNVAINYSGTWDIIQATKKIAVKACGSEIAVDDIDHAMIQDALCLANQPPPDLFIRTSGEQRLSDFMLWQLAYAELYFTDVAWPDFSVAELDKACDAFAERERRFGKTGDQLKKKEGTSAC